VDYALPFSVIKEMTENACCQIEDIIGKESNEENGFIEWRTDPSSDNISVPCDLVAWIV
jgi:hypothetical protein